ncbi:MAG: CRTAC1 family protein [Deltaproteobacteria bacterium]|nr:CRTAC1 family protein [Deltaproteobacteria bacterium]
MTILRPALVAAACLTACGGASTPVGDKPASQRTYDTDDAEAPARAPEVPPAASLSDAVGSLSPRRAQIADTAAAIVAKIRELETSRDVTCWTSFRQLDNFIASKSYSNFATLTKIAAAKALAHGVWVAASQRAGGAAVTLADVQAVSKVDAALPAAKKDGLAQLPADLEAQHFKDYRTTSEHWRVLLSIAQDELLLADPRVKPLAPDAADELAVVATKLSLALLTESGEIATEARTPYIEADHVKRAFTNLVAKFEIPAVPPVTIEAAQLEAAKPALLVLTRQLIDAKIEALQRFNKASGGLAGELNKISKIPVSEPGAARLREKLGHFADFMARGYEPMRADNYLADGNFADKPQDGLAYIDPTYVENATMQLFPYVMMPNGDVKLRFERRPGTIITADVEPADVVLLDHQMNAVRDTAIHWLVLQDLWAQQPFAMDPFAGEYLSELTSIVGTFWMRRAQTMARAGELPELGPELFEKVQDNRWAMVLPVEEEQRDAWTPARQRAKEVALAPYGAALFADVSAAWGLPGAVAVTVEGAAHAGGAVPDVGAHSGKQVPAQGKDVGAHSGQQVPAQGKDVGAHSGTQVPAQGKDVGAHSGQQVPAQGKDVGAHSGADGAAHAGESGFDIQKVMGSGIAVGDVDGDGDSDLFLAGIGFGRLLLNDIGAGNRRFIDATAAWGITADMVDSHHAMFFDHDGDGDLDLLVVRGRNPSLLYDNQGGKLVDVAATRGLATGPGAHVASAFDYDRDGDLDLYVGYYGSAACNRGACEGRNLPSVDGRNGSPNQLFRLDGERYTEVAAEAGVADEGWTLASGTFDYDGDGDVDLYLANDFGANPLFRNDGNGRFTDVALELGAADRGSGMNVSFSDLDRNGSFDVFVANIDMFSKTIKVVFPQDQSVVNLTDGILRSFQYLSGNKLYLNLVGDDGVRRFEAQEGKWFEPGDRGWGWASVFFDYENDGDEDIYLANGWIPGSPAADQRNQMFVFDDHTFYLTPTAAPEAFEGNSRCAVSLDVDRDGDLDLVVNNFAQPPRLLENIQRGKHAALRLELRGADRNTRAVGAVVEVRSGKTVQRRQITAGLGYLGQDDEVVHVGLGRARTADVTVHWPDGTQSSHPRLATGAVHTISQAR